EVVGEVIRNAIALGAAVNRPHVNNVVADEQVGSRAGATGTDPERRDTRADHISGSRDGEGIGRPRFGRPQARGDEPNAQVVRDSGPKEATALRRDGIRGANDLHAKRRVATKLPQNAPAYLKALAVVARQFHECSWMFGEKVLEVFVNRSQFNRVAGLIGE